MPSAITYSHPSLSLGNVVDTQLLDLINKISRCQADMDVAREKLHSLIQMKRSMLMTINELQDMNVDVSELRQKQADVDGKINQAAGDYLSVRMAKEDEIQTLVSEINNLKIRNDLESILDFSASPLQTIPLSTESLNMDSQYFSYGSSLQDDTIANIEKFIRTSTGNNPGLSDRTAKDVTSQISGQVQNHNISGTLIIVAGCTHQHVRLYEPVNMDPDKAVSVWNTVYENDKIVIPESKADIPKLDRAEQTASLSIITGASYGSSFVGMVHILKSDANRSDDFENIKENIEKKMQIGGWLENTAGGFGINETAMNEVKALLSSQSVSSHISIIATGAIPSFKSGELNQSVNKLATVDEDTVKSIVSISKAEKPTTSSDATEAQQRALLLNVQNARINAIMKNMQAIDQSKNRVLDVNSLMDAFENYIASIRDGKTATGIPNNFYIKKITKADIVSGLVRKYFPDSGREKGVKNGKPDSEKPKNRNG
jgi:hypothetical protein